jgi:hypothetical protein
MATLSKYWFAGKGHIIHFDGDDWTAQDISGVTDYPDVTITGIHTTNGKLLFAVGLRRGGSDFDPLILKSTDGGTTWVMQPTTGLASGSQGVLISDVHVVSATEVYFTGHKRLTTKGYVWKFDGTSSSEVYVGTAGSQHYSIYAPAVDDVYIGDTGNEYRHGSGFTAFPTAGTIAGWDAYDNATLVRGNSATQVAVLGSLQPAGAPYTMIFALGSSGAFPSSTVMKSNFYTQRLNGNKNLAVNTLGQVFILARNRTSGNAEVANNKGFSVAYDILGAHSGTLDGVALTAGGEGDICAVYNKVTTEQLTSWFYSATTGLWTQDDTLPVMTTEVFCGTSYADVGHKGFDMTGISFEIGVRPGGRRIGPDRRIGG